MVNNVHDCDGYMFNQLIATFIRYIILVISFRSKLCFKSFILISIHIIFVNDFMPNIQMMVQHELRTFPLFLHLF